MEAPKLKLLANAGAVRDPVIIRSPGRGWMVKVAVINLSQAPESGVQTWEEWVTVRGGAVRVFKKIETALKMLEEWGLSRAMIDLRGEGYD